MVSYNPLIIELSAEGRFKLQKGRRMAATKMVGLDEVPAIVLKGIPKP